MADTTLQYLQYLHENGHRLGHPAYYTWQHQAAQPVTLLATGEVIPLPPAAWQRKNLHPKACYYNAWRVCSLNRAINYVEGYISFAGIAILHAWNALDGKHFDPTRELLMQEPPNGVPYTKIIELTADQVDEYASQTGAVGEFLYYHWTQEQKVQSEHSRSVHRRFIHQIHANPLHRNS